LTALAAGDAAEIGNCILLEPEYSLADEQTVASLFGDAFAARVFSLEPGQWHGPVASGYGFHLVRISQRQAAQPRPFDEVRPQLLDEWYRIQQARAKAQFLAGLLKQYDLVVEESIRPLLGPLTEVLR
jgi:parvulin-like peptidyl-prolyl isomerase